MSDEDMGGMFGMGGAQAGGTAGMWMKMLGLDQLWDQANSPGFQQQIATLVQAIIETRQSVARIEGMLAELLQQRTSANVGNGPAALPPPGPSVGPGQHGLTGASLDAGSGGAPQAAGDAGRVPEHTGDTGADAGATDCPGLGRSGGLERTLG